jgi:hypothetical protein
VSDTIEVDVNPVLEKTDTKKFLSLDGNLVATIKKLSVIYVGSEPSMPVR